MHIVALLYVLLFVLIYFRWFQVSINVKSTTLI